MVVEKLLLETNIFSYDDFAEQWGAKISWILLEKTKAMILMQSIIELILIQDCFFV